MSEQLKEKLHGRRSQATEEKEEQEKPVEKVSRPRKEKAVKEPSRSVKQLGFAGKCVYNPNGQDLKGQGRD